MANVKYYAGLAADLPASRSYDSFYRTTDTNELYIGMKKITNAEDLETLANRVGSLNDLTTEEKTSIVAAINALKASLKDVATTGAAADVTIADVGNIITAVNVEDALQELVGMIQANGSNAKVTMEKPAGTEYAAVYEFYQGVAADDSDEVKAGKKIGTINIPKDMVVESGTVETDPAGQPAGTYLVLTLANATNDKVYINVGSLIEYVTGGDTTEISVAVDPSTHVVTATIKKIAASKIEYKANTAEEGQPDNSESVAQALARIDTALGDKSVATQITEAVEALDSTVKNYTGDEPTTGLVVEIEEEDGKLKTVSAVIKADTYDAYGAADALKGVAASAQASDTTIEGAKKYADAAVAAAALVWEAFPQGE